MPLIKDEVIIPIDKGIDSFSDPKQAQRMGTCQNMFVTREGEVQRRAGLEKFSTSRTVVNTYREATAALASAVAVVPFRGSPVVLGKDLYTRTVGGIASVSDLKSGGAAFAVKDNAADTAWTVMGEASFFDIEHVRCPDPLPQTSLQQPEIHHAVSESYEIFVYTKSGVTNMYYAVRNTETKTWVYVSDTAITSFTPKAVVTVDYDSTPANGERFLIVGTAGTTVKLASVTPSTGAVSTGTLGTAAADVNGRSIDICPAYEGTVKVALVADTAIYLAKVTGDLATVRGYTVNQACSGRPIVTVTQGDNDYIILADVIAATRNVMFHAFDADYENNESPLASSGWGAYALGTTATAVQEWRMSIVAGTHTAMAVGRATGTHSFILAASGGTQDAGGDPQAMETVFVDGTFTSTQGSEAITIANTTGGVLRNAYLNSKLFLKNQRVYVPLRTGANVDTSANSVYSYNMLLLGELRMPETTASDALVCHMAGCLVAQDLAHQRPTDDVTQEWVPAHTVVDDDGLVHVPYAKQTRLSSKTTTTIVSTGQPCAAILNFTPRPSQIALSGPDVLVGGSLLRQLDGGIQEVGFFYQPELFSITTPAGGALSEGDYSALLVAEWIDRNGQCHRSRPGEALTVTAAANDRFLLHAAIPQLCGFTGEYAGLSSKLGTTVSLFRNTIAQPAIRRRVDAVISNIPGYLGYAYFSGYEGTADSTIGSHEVLYTDGDELENDPPPASNIILSHHNRVFLVPTEDPASIWFSKERLPGVGLSFSARLTINVLDAGDIVGLASLDDYVVVFKENAIFVFSGTGPNVLGEGSFTPPQRINANIGCRDTNSVVSFDGGVLFKSNAGWQLLDRSLQVVPIGLPVKDYDSDTVTRAILVPELRQIRVLHDYNDTDTQLVYDIIRQKWDTLLPALGFSLNVSSIVDICAIDGTVYHLGHNGWLYTETLAGTATDGDVAFTPKLVSPWVSTDLVNFERIWKVKVLGEWPASGSLTVKFYHDYSDTASETQTVDVSTIGSDGLLPLKPSRAICNAFRIELSGALYRVSRIALEVGRDRGRIGRTTTPTVV